ncbi:6-phosphogluconolactonase [Cupriavidus basilensis]|uniref:6-phosphogluconolactonase n=1 Tax=Cupriavidus basilensis TaxID=68895 RepID=UPI0039F6F5BE
MQVFNFDDPQAQALALASRVSELLRNLIARQGRACLAVSGGRSPLPLFTALRHQKLDWSKVTITLVDERAVPAAHPDCNARLVAGHLLQDQAAQACLLPLVPHISPMASDTDLHAALAQANRQRVQADIVVLGMGDDGHTASLFPDAPELPQATSLDQPPSYVVTSPRVAPHRRITLNLTALLRSQFLLLAIAGNSKQQAFARAAQTRTAALPVSFLIHQNEVPFDVYRCN